MTCPPSLSLSASLCAQPLEGAGSTPPSVCGCACVWRVCVCHVTCRPQPRPSAPAALAAASAAVHPWALPAPRVSTPWHRSEPVPYLCQLAMCWALAQLASCVLVAACLDAGRRPMQGCVCPLRRRVPTNPAPLTASLSPMPPSSAALGRAALHGPRRWAEGAETLRRAWTPACLAVPARALCAAFALTDAWRLT
jgi:hypothetical protein